MKRLAVLLLFASLMLSTATGQPPPQTIRPESLPSTDRLPGVDLAQGVAQLTGVAISPLLGVSTVGAWRYYHTEETKRYLLPWFCRPYIWGVAFCLLALCFMKDLFGTAAPPLVKKTLDMAELFESKVSALVACSAFLPFIVSEMSRHFPASDQTATVLSSSVHLTPLAVLPLALSSFDLRIIAIPIAIVGFLIVWLAGHAINVLIALCPFGFIDSLLKLLKLSLLGAVLVSSLISPYLGAGISLVILAFASLIAPWAFRLTFFGSCLAWDILFPARTRRRIQPAEPHVFLARRLATVPTRKHGHLTRTETGDIVFVYRPWLIMTKRSVAMPSGSVAISKGLFFPTLLHRLNDKERMKTLIIFLPRYRSHEQVLAEHLGIIDVQDSTLLRGLKAVRGWIADTINFGKSRYAELHSSLGR
jgi:hypothetical protein